MITPETPFDITAHCPFKNVGMISTRLCGTDGVSLETDKWTHVLERMGLTCFYMAGELDRPDEKSFRVEEAHFKHPDILRIYNECFGETHGHSSGTQRIHAMKDS